MEGYITITVIVHCLRYKKENQTEEAKKYNKERNHKTQQTKQQRHVTLSTELQFTALMLNFLAASNGFKICLKNLIQN